MAHEFSLLFLLALFIRVWELVASPMVLLSLHVLAAGPRVTKAGTASKERC